MSDQPRLTAATVIHHVVADLLHQQKFGFAHSPEVVDLAVIITGLGTLNSSFSFVKQVGSFWDSTYWDASPRPFLDSRASAYANAIAAWIRDERDPVWARGLSTDLKRPMAKSLKYLFKTDDSFFRHPPTRQHLLQQPQRFWLEMASQSAASSQVIAIRQLRFDEPLREQQEKLLLEKLKAPARSPLLHAISAIESLQLDDESIIEELAALVDNRDNEISAKSMIAISKLGKLDEQLVNKAARMVDSQAKHVVFAGVFALCALESVPEHVLRAAERGFLRALQSCDYEFVGLFAAAFNRWLADPASHFVELMQDDDPEYLEIVLEALQNVREQSVALN